MFEELTQKYAYKEINKVIKFLLHSMGSDMKSKGPSISRGELHNLMTETRTLQAILGVYRFFKGRMFLMGKLFEKDGLQMPNKLNFETMAKAFMNLVSERYPSSDKVLGQAKRLGIEDWILAKIIAFSQFRDSIRELAMSQIYRSLQHRDELSMAIIEALEELEDELEELEEKEEFEDYEEEEEEK
jgi:type III secretion protein W